jgi:hypothetical protein
MAAEAVASRVALSSVELVSLVSEHDLLCIYFFEMQW